MSVWKFNYHMREKVILNVIYRTRHGKVSLTLQEIDTPTLENEINETDVIYLGDCNICVDDIRITVAQSFLRLIKYFSLFILMKKPKFEFSYHKKHHSPAKSLPVCTIIFYLILGKINFLSNFNFEKVERKLIRFRKKCL